MPRGDPSLRSKGEIDQIREEAMAFAGIGLCRYRFDGAVIFVDPGAVRILDLEGEYPDPSALVGESVWSLFEVPGGMAGFEEQVRDRKGVRDFEVRLRTRSGKNLWVLFNAYVVWDESAGQDVIQVMMRDVSGPKRAEEALRQSEREKVSILNSVSELVSYQDRDLRVVWANRVAGESVSTAPSRLVGRRCHEIWQGRTDPCPGCPVERAIETGEPHQAEMTTPDGRVWFVRGYPVRSESGDVVGVVEVTLEVTDRRRAEEALRRSEENFRLVTETIQDVFWMSTPGITRMIYVSPAFERVWGRSRESLYRDPHSVLEGVHPEDRPRVAEAIEGHARGVWDLEYRIVKPDGSIRWIHDRGFPIRDEDGTLVRMTGVAADVTERKLAEDALRTSELQYRTTLDSMGDAIHVVDRDLRLILVNRTFRRWTKELGLEVDTGESTVFEVFPFLPEKVREEYEQVFKTGRTLVTEEQTKIGDREFLTETRKIPVFERDEVVRVVTTVRDVTQRRRAEEERRRLQAQIQHAQKLESLGVLAGGIAHDFNNLLMGILGNADLALMHLPSSSPARDNIEGVQTAGKRAADLCRQLLAYSGKGRFVVEYVDLGELVQEMAHLIDVSISKRITLKYGLAEDLPPMEADATQIRQIVLNLITNASEAIGEHSGTIRIRTGVSQCDRARLSRTYLGEDLPEGAYLFLEVSDTGCGMDEETRARIFDPFFTTKFTGRGLGLAAVIGIVRGHGGALKVKSSVGRGTTFTVLFPTARRSARRRNGDRTPSRAWRGQGTVLVIDDEEAVRSVTRGMLEKFGFSVLAASDGEQGVSLFRDHASEISVVLLDLTMPRMGGEETFEEIRRQSPKARVILTSGFSEQEVAKRFKGKKVAGFLQKPYQASALKEKLREVLGAG